MSVLKIAFISPKYCGSAFTCVKKASERLCDENYSFDFLPRVYSLYERSENGELLRSRFFTKKADLTAVFFDACTFDISMRVLLETMEYCSRTVVIIENAYEAGFDTEAFSGALGIKVFHYENSRASILNIMDLIRTYAVSLFYTSPTYINYGPDAEYALSLLERSARDVFGNKNKTWSAVRLLRGGIFLKELFSLFSVDTKTRASLYKDMSTAALYLHNCTPSIDFPKHAEDVLESITETLKESCLKEYSHPNEKDSYLRVFWVIIYALICVCALTVTGMIFFD